MMDLEELAARVVELERRVDTLKAREERLVEAMREASEHACLSAIQPGTAHEVALGVAQALDIVVRSIEGERKRWGW